MCLCVCPFHQKTIRRSLSNLNSTNGTFGRNVSLYKNKLSKLQPSRLLFQVPGVLKSSKRKEYSNRKLIG